jgi:hypothetical protein
MEEKHLIKFILTYFDGDGYPSVWFDTEEELNQFIKKEDIYDLDVIEIAEVKVIRTIKHLTMEERDREINKRMETFIRSACGARSCDSCSDYGRDNCYPCPKYCLTEVNL